MPTFSPTPFQTLLATAALLLATGCSVDTARTEAELADTTTQQQQDDEAAAPATLIELLETKLQDKPLANPMVSELGTSPEEAEALHDQLDLSSGAFTPAEEDQAGADAGPINIDVSPPAEEDEPAEETTDLEDEDCTEADFAGDVIANIMDAPLEVKPGELLDAASFHVVVEKLTRGDFGDLKLALFLAKSDDESKNTALQLTPAQPVAEPDLAIEAKVELPDVLLPSDLASGKYAFLVRVDEGPEASACVRDNNRAFASVKVL